VVEGGWECRFPPNTQPASAARRAPPLLLLCGKECPQKSLFIFETFLKSIISFWNASLKEEKMERKMGRKRKKQHEKTHIEQMKHAIK
jgi:hypothetical protein